ncbi:MAG: NAD(P)H-dependent oxidoreductase [Burkholderiales bacterium]
MTPRILVFAGSARRDSLNKRLARVAARTATEAGGSVTLIDFDDYPMPLYHGDIEDREGVPQNARKLKALFIEHQGLLIVSPENNASVSALLKNTLDWISRPDGGQNGLVPYREKVAALMAASPGAFGGMRGLVALRAILQTLNVLVLAEQFLLPRADDAFDEDGELKDLKQQASVAAIARRLVEVTGGVAARR